MMTLPLALYVAYPASIALIFSMPHGHDDALSQEVQRGVDLRVYPL
jgi:hypothetical protein